MTTGGDAAQVDDNDVDANAVSPPVGVRANVRLRLDIRYDGQRFSGWAQQRDRRTVQEELQQALMRVLRLSDVQLTVAGRTDAGVHATGQVAHLDVPAQSWHLAQPRAARSLNGLLPSDIRIASISEVTFDFDARFSALWRRYEYRISDAADGGDPLRRGFVLQWPRALNVAAMNQAAGAMLGLQNFAAFCRFKPEATSIRTLQSFTVTRADDTGEIICALQADAFCHSMVRSLVGALLAVGAGRRSPQWPASLLARTTRADDVGVAPPHGLVLVEVGYPPAADLAARTVQTRRRRDSD